jgi:hypothetical protein
MKLDLQPAYIPFEFQANKSDGTKFDPSASSIIIYEESGSDSSFDSSQISGSPFTPVKINSKTGNYGVLIDKSLFTVGKYYRILYEATIDSIASAYQETYFMVNSSQLKADVSTIESNVELILNGGKEVFRSITYDVAKRAEIQTLKYGNVVTPDRTVQETIIYDSEGKAINFNTEEV